MQKVGEAHDTSPPPPGIACGVHDVPFHISANVGLPPAASQKVADAHETLLRIARLSPTGTGTGCPLHAVPFQVSASGTSPELVKAKPTASQDVGDVQDTEDRTAELEPDGPGTDWIVQEVPFQDSARMIPLGPFW
jgi:hypothetical protein